MKAQQKKYLPKIKKEIFSKDRCFASGKIMHSTKREAELQLKSMRHQMSYNGLVYACRACRQFHVGRPKEQTIDTSGH